MLWESKVHGGRPCNRVIEIKRGANGSAAILFVGEITRWIRINCVADPCNTCKANGDKSQFEQIHRDRFRCYDLNAWTVIPAQ
jgi:hypothetical protein